MYLTNQQSVTLANELNQAQSVFPTTFHSVVKLSLYAPSGKVNATFNFASIVELRHFIELNQPPRYQVWC
jgi:hypothetical protein